MKKHQNLYILGAVLVLVGGYMYIAKNKANKVDLTTPPMEADNTTADNTTPTTPATNGTLSGASQVIDSIKGLIAEIKTKSVKAVKPLTQVV